MTLDRHDDGTFKALDLTPIERVLRSHDEPTVKNMLARLAVFVEDAVIYDFLATASTHLTGVLKLRDPAGVQRLVHWEWDPDEDLPLRPYLVAVIAAWAKDPSQSGPAWVYRNVSGRPGGGSGDA